MEQTFLNSFISSTEERNTKEIYKGQNSVRIIHPIYDIPIQEHIYMITVTEVNF
jgi:hypothetical protein